MLLRISIIISFGCILWNQALGQTDFRKGLEASNPIEDSNALPIERQIDIHLKFLADAQQEKHVEHELKFYVIGYSEKYVKDIVIDIYFSCKHVFDECR